MIPGKDIKNILLMKLRGIGDVVLTTAAIKAIHLKYPEARIDYLTEKPGSFIIEPLPEINSVILFKRKGLYNRLKTILRIRRRKYDLIIDFFSNPTTAQITYLSKAKYRAGYPYKGRKYAYNIFGPSERNKYHAAELHNLLTESAGISITDKSLRIGLYPEDMEFAERFFSENKLDESKVTAICPTGGWASKKCPPEKFAEIAESILNNTDSVLLLLWGPGDEEDADKIKEMLGEKILKAPDTSLRQMAALISKCDVMVANDSGPMHMATAVGTSAVSLHGPTSPLLQGPFGDRHRTIRNEELECIECNMLDCPRNQECFRELNSEEIAGIVEELLRLKDANEKT